MILVISLILFMIFLIYSIRPINHEPYKIDEVKISWTNKSGIEGTVNKWILVLVNSSGVELHRLENTDVNNRKNFTNVTIPFIQNKDFDDKIFGENKLKVYWNTVNDDNNLLLTTNITFNRDDFSASISNLVLTDNNFNFIVEIPYQINGALDNWCNHDGAVHQDVPGCGRICSDSNNNGRKDQGTWGSWKTTSVNCPAAKLDDIWKEVNGTRTLKVGKVSQPSKDCVLSGWTNSGGCSKTCGNGNQLQYKYVTSAQTGDGKCNIPPNQTVPCNTHNCPPINCQMGNWYNSGGCSKTCGGGTQRQYRNIIQQPANGGAVCGATSQDVPCNTHQFNRIYNDLHGGNDVIGYYPLEECKSRCASNNTGQKYTCQAFLHRSDNNACRIYNTQSPRNNIPGGYTAWLKC